MKTKDQVLDKFKEYEAMVTNITGKKIKILRSDNGGEYTPKEFVNYLTYNSPAEWSGRKDE